MALLTSRYRSATGAATLVAFILVLVFGSPWYVSWAGLVLRFEGAGPRRARRGPEGVAVNPFYGPVRGTPGGSRTVRRQGYGGRARHRMGRVHLRRGLRRTHCRGRVRPREPARRAQLGDRRCGLWASHRLDHRSRVDGRPQAATVTSAVDWRSGEQLSRGPVRQIAVGSRRSAAWMSAAVRYPRSRPSSMTRTRAVSLSSTAVSASRNVALAGTVGSPPAASGSSGRSPSRGIGVTASRLSSRSAPTNSATKSLAGARRRRARRSGRPTGSPRPGRG